MGSRIRCPHCEEEFFAAATTGPLHCPACSERIPGPAGGKAAPAATVSATAASRAGPVLARKCPSCGTRYEGGVRRCPECGVSYLAAKQQAATEGEEASGSFALENRGVNKGVLGGVVMVVIGAVWFFGGLAAGVIFYYPPVLAAIGVYAILKGLVTGNLAGKPRVPPRLPRRG